MRAKLVFTDKTLTDADLFDGVTQIEDVGAGGDLQYGTAAMGEVSFSTMKKLTEGERFVLSFDQSEDGSNEFSQAGIYYVSSCKSNGGRYAVMAHDSMALFEVDVSAWLNGLSYPITLYTLLSSLCKHIGVTLETVSIPNGERAIPKNFSASGITGRQVLAWIADAAACFAVFRADGRLYLDGYSAAEIALDKSNTTEYIAEEYTTDRIDRVQVRSAEADIGVVVGTGLNAYVVESNPLLLAETDAELRPFAETIYSLVSTVQHVPFTCHMLTDNGIRVGDIITIDGAVSCVMRLERTPGGVTISATGGKRRAAQGNETNAEIIRLRGKTNELIRTVDETTIRLSNAEGAVTTLTATVGGLDGRIESAEADVLSLTARADTFDVSLTNANKDIAALTARADSITLSVDQNTLAISNLGIQLSGYVTFTDLSTSGQTTINGGNITTGTISAINIDGCSIGGGSIYSLASNNTSILMSGGKFTLYNASGTAVGGFHIDDLGNVVLSGNPLQIGEAGYNVKFMTNPSVLVGNNFYANIHAGNISNYIGNVYAVFG